jgi:dolichol-phosphate mannosyltransferase
MVIVVLPVFNESNGIEEFFTELNLSLRSYSPTFLVVDDKSTDSTHEILSRLKAKGFPLVVLQNVMNSGHGFSVIKGLTSAIMHRSNSIILYDGDGQFDGNDVKALFEIHLENVGAIVEGVRVGRNDPWFRRFISGTTRILVWTINREKPKDANTPLRIFYRSEIDFVLSKIKETCLIPNLAISSISRTLGIPILEIDVRSLPPRRNRATVDQWKQKSNYVPSLRLVKFVAKAFISWINVAKVCKLLKAS